MSSVNGMSAEAMIAIAENSITNGAVVDTQLILTTRGGTLIDAGHVKGTPGAPGGTDEAFEEWINNPASNTVNALSNLLTPAVRNVGLKDQCVVVGSTTSTNAFGIQPWCVKVAQRLGLTLRNFAVQNTGFNGLQSFWLQMQAAAADPSFDNDDVAVVFICDASKSVQSWDDTGTTDDITNNVIVGFQYAKDTFPNARIVCIPVIWPAWPSANMVGYQNVWPYALTQIIEQIKWYAIEYDVEFVDYSHTWLTGWPGYMLSGQIGLPHQGGQDIISGWVMRHMRGLSTRADGPWTNVIHQAGSTVSTRPGAPRFRARREGWTVHYKGSLYTVNAGVGDQILVTFPIGFRPPISAEIQFRAMDDIFDAFTGQIYLDGRVQITNIVAGVDYITSGSFTLH